MMQRRHLLAVGAGAAASLAAPAIRAQGTAGWPSGPVRLVVPFAAGGPTDIPARLIAEEMSKLLPQRVVVENRTGSGVVVGTDLVAKAPKDGLTLLYSTIAHAVLRVLFTRLPFDPVGDFSPIALAGQVPMILMVNKELPVNSLADLVRLLRENPGRYSYASSGAGGAVHLATELFLNRAGGLRVEHVPYRGSAAAMPDVLSGRVPIILDVAAGAVPYMQRGELKALGISTRQRSSIAPDLPTFIEGGVPDYEAYTWHMFFAPSGTPAPVIQQVNAVVNQVMAMDAVKRRLSDLTMDTRSDTTPDTAKAFLDAEIAKWEPLVRAAGIRPE
ncbi:tripartite tricarboxylate transporter substrate binding protein [Muricoccus radiodurans]|uniref:tripartite tricarboxylate transporter substrate binding protein n=1 Tax=Muricoccus radiodurans TaxID=2231721 RepID=UPI003CF80C40